MNRKSWFLLKQHLPAAALGLLFLFTSGLSHAQITPLADSFTNTADPTTNYGSATLLEVDGASLVTYIQFPLSSIPSGASVSQATLKLYVNAVTTAGSFNVDYVNGAWTESTIDASNAPPLGGTIASNVNVTAADKNQYILINVTSAVQAWLSGSETNNGLALAANSTFFATFDSKENTGTSHPVELDIAYAGGDGTITGVTTASGSGLTGGGTSGTLDLSLNSSCAKNQILEWNGSAWACSSAGTGTITGVTAGNDLTGGGSSGNVTLSLNTAEVPLLASANLFTGANTFTGNQTIQNGGLAAETAAQSAAAAMVGTGSDGHNMSLYPSLATEDYNGIVEAGDSAIIYSQGSQGTGNFVIAPWADATSGLRVNSSGWVGIGTASPTATLEVLASDQTGVTAITGNADGGYGATFYNNNYTYETLAAVNAANAGDVFLAYNSFYDAQCNIDYDGDLNCTGTKNAVVPVDDGKRWVAMSAIESPVNWFEDAGSAKLVNGVAVVELDPTFIQTVNTTMDYEVFPVPHGDCKGLYVTNRTATSFEVRELGGGTSSVDFGYRIMAVRKNYETVRFADRTDNIQKSRALPGRIKPAGTKSPSLNPQKATPATPTRAALQPNSAATTSR
jgi:hypothetical protein